MLRYSQIESRSEDTCAACPARSGPTPFLPCLRREEVEIGAEFRRVKVELLNIPYLPLNIVGAVVGEAVHRIISDLAEFPEHPAVRVLAEVEVIVCVPLGLNPAVVFGAVGGVEFAVEFLAWFVYAPDSQDVRHEVAVIPQQERERMRVRGIFRRSSRGRISRSRSDPFRAESSA